MPPHSAPQGAPENLGRLSALRQYDILNTAPEEPFDRVAELASQVLDTPAAVVSFIDDSREWMKARKNVDREQVSLNISFGAHAIRSDGVFVVEDTTDDVRFAENPLVTGEPNVRFYCGAPLVTPIGHRIGTVAALDTVPRAPSTEQREQLATLAALLVDHLETRRERANLDQVLKPLLRQSGVHSVVLDRDGKILQVSEDWQAFAEANGVHDDGDLATGVNYLKAWMGAADVEEELARTIRNGIRAVLTGEQLEFEHIYTHPTAEKTRWYHLRVITLDHPKARAVVSHVDVTDLKQRTQRRRFLATAVEQAKETVLITEGAPLDNPGPKITYVNPAFTSTTGYSAEDVLGETPRLLQGPDTEPGVLDRVRRHLERGESFEGETINYKKDGTPYVNHWSISPVRDDDGTITHWVSVQRDVTEQRLMDMRLLRAREKERHRIGMEIHDEVGGLLASLQMFLSLLQDEEGNQSAQSVPVKDLEETVTKLSDAVRNLTGELHSRVLNDYGFKKALRHLINELEDRSDIRVTLHDELEDASTLPSLLQRVAYRGIREALTNVVEHAETDRAQVHLTTSNRTLHIQITDEGRGFDSADRDRGMHQYGLIRTRERVERLNGTLEVHSSPGEGTRVTMSLPIPPVTLLDE